MHQPDTAAPPQSWTARTPFFYGWTILGVASLGMFISGPGQTYAVSIFVDPIIEETGWSRTSVAGLYALGSGTAAFTMPFVGRLLDKYGARILLTVVGTLFGFAALWMSTVSIPLQLYIGFALIRTLGQGSLTMVPTTLVAIWFMRMRGRATAVTFLGSAVSQAAFPPLIDLLISQFGWRGAWVALAFIIWGAILLPVILLVRRSPESVGLLPDGDKPTVEEDDADQPAITRETNWTLAEALRTRALWLLLFAGSSQSLIGTALVFHQVSLFEGKGLEASVAATVFTVMAPAAVGASLIAGYLADKVPNRYVLAAGQVLLAVAMALTFTISAAWHAYGYGMVIGFGSGLIMTTNAVIWPNYFGRRYIGSIRGIATTSMVAFAAIGPLPFAVIFDLTGSYTPAILIFLALPASCAVAAMFAPPPNKREPQPIAI